MDGGRRDERPRKKPSVETREKTPTRGKRKKRTGYEKDGSTSQGGKELYEKNRKAHRALGIRERGVTILPRTDIPPRRGEYIKGILYLLSTR